MIENKIEHGIPIPPIKITPLEERFPQFLSLEINDSFVILDKEFPMHFVIGEWGRNNNRRHEVRKLDNGDYRVWRVK
jgi:hypothetical protein